MREFCPLNFIKATLFLFIIFFSIFGFAKEIVLATLEWPPHTCERCPGQGAGISVLKKLFEEEGHTLKVIFYPWSRCIELAKKGTVGGCWPSWNSDLIDTDLVPSDILYSSSVGLAERVDDPVNVKSLRDLQKVRFGAVQDYGYSQEYLELVRSGVLKPEIVRTDVQNLKKLESKRIDATIIDELNFRYLMSLDKSLKNKIKLHNSLFGSKDLVIGMNKNNAKELGAIILAIKKRHPELHKEFRLELEKILRVSAQ